jgi:hypothetical protein
MIRIDFTAAMLFFLLVGICLLFAWMILETRKSRKESRLKEDLYLWECPMCFHTYINSREQTISRCPRCKSLHRRHEKTGNKNAAAVLMHHT